jgi:hypothetical protein
VSGDTWLFSACGGVLVVHALAGLRQPRYPAWFTDTGSFSKGRGWLPGVVGCLQWAVGVAWLVTCLAMAGEFGRYVFGPQPGGGSGGEVAMVWLRLLSAIALMFGFVGTAMRWAWNKGYERARGAEGVASS